MFRALAHQLLPESYHFLQLRTIAADFMREHPEEFLPYLTKVSFYFPFYDCKMFVC